MLKEKSLRINIVGLSNSRQSVFCREGISLDNYEEVLKASPVKSTPEEIRDSIIKMNIFNSVFVDCTASPEIAAIYQQLLDHNVSVVAANKVAASSDYENYAWLKQTARRRDVKFLFETNVGAGIAHYQHDKQPYKQRRYHIAYRGGRFGNAQLYIQCFERGRAVEPSHTHGERGGVSAEPDPRVDLSGQDVLRKLVILAREAGYRMEQSDVQKDLFIPEKYFEGSLDDFWKEIPELDAEFEQRRREVAAQGKRSRFVASLSEGKARIGLQAVGRGREHPFDELEGSNNVILITTDRYNEYPMIIKGYGAGAPVTAAGVFADIIGIANIR